MNIIDIDLQKKVNFIVEIDKLKSIYRKALIQSDGNREENTAEHSWHVALMALVFKDYANEEIDINKVIQMLLVHDLVEIYAGDTYAFADQSVLKLQREKELKALDKVMSILPKNNEAELKALWLEFEFEKSPEAKFAKAIEKSIPVYQNMNNNGGSWSRNNTKSSQVLKRNETLKEIAPKLWEYVLMQVDKAINQGWLTKE